MDKVKNKEDIFPNKKTVYGPVKSWRFGESLGIDPIFETSTCSFNCIYCQLGHIQDITNEIKIYVPTESVINDFQNLIDQNIPIDVITYSGSGEPTLASNLGDMILKIKEISPDIPQYVLTNATTLNDPSVQKNLKLADKVILKLDACDEKTFSQVNRPVDGVTLEVVIKGIKSFLSDYQGEVEVQSMFMPINNKQLDNFAKILKDISPNIVQLNTPKRPYPMSWHRENRGNHLGIHDHDIRNLKTVTKEEALSIEEILRQETGLNILSIYRS
jgi:wyosine [tRNA(Phe)-imidazoG37] synthetase (radical SAM superfamily)